LQIDEQHGITFLLQLMAKSIEFTRDGKAELVVWKMTKLADE